MVELPMSMSPLPETRNTGAFTSRSSLCATPFLMVKLAVISEKSVCCVCRASARASCEPSAAFAFEQVLLGEVAQQRAHRNAGERFLHRHAAIGHRRDGAGGRALVEVHRV